MRRLLILLALCAPSFGAITQIAHTSATDSTGATVLTTSAINCTGANFIWVGISAFTTLTHTITDSSGNTYTAYGSFTTDNVNHLAFYVASATVSSSMTFTDTAGSTDFVSIAVGCYSGVMASSPTDGNNGAGCCTVASTGYSPGAITTTANGDLIITAVAGTNTSNASVGGSFTLTDQQLYGGGGTNTSLAAAYQVQVSSGSINSTWTTGTLGSATDGGEVAIYAFKAAPSNGIQFLTSVGGTCASGCSVTSATTGSMNTTGANFIVVGVAYYDNFPQTVTDNQSNTYTALTAYGAAANAFSQLFYTCNPVTSASHTFTTTGSSASFQAIYAAAFKNVQCPGPFDVGNGAGPIGSGTTFQPGSITPSLNGELIVTPLSNFETSGTDSINSSFTLLSQQLDVSSTNIGLDFAYLIQSTAAAINPTWTSAAPASLTIASFKATVASSGGGGGSLLLTGVGP